MFARWAAPNIAIYMCRESDRDYCSFSPDVQLAFQDVHARLTKDLKERLDGVLETSVLVSPVDVPELLTLWHALLGLGQWMALESKSVHPRGPFTIPDVLC